MKKLFNNFDNNDELGGNMVFLDAPGGTGETFTLNVIISYIRTNNKNVSTYASSGISANLLYM